MNVDSQDADTQMSQPVEGSQATQDEAMADVPDSKVEVPTSSAVEIPSTPNTKKNEKDDEEVLETPRIQSGQTLKKSNANKSSKSRQKTRETTSTSGTKPSYEETVQSIDASQDGSETIADASKQSAVEEGQATAGSEQANGSQANGAKKERPAFNPYEAASIIPRSPLEIGLDEQRLKTVGDTCFSLSKAILFYAYLDIAGLFRGRCSIIRVLTRRSYTGECITARHHEEVRSTPKEKCSAGIGKNKRISALLLT